MKIDKVIIFLIALVLFIVWNFYSPLKRTSQIHKVVITEKGFEPQHLTVTKGDIVQFSTSLDTPFWPASDPHPLHSIYSKFDSLKPVSPSAKWEFRPNLGVWKYHDHLYPIFRGEITVLNKKDMLLKDQLLTREKITSLISKDDIGEVYLVLKQVYSASEDLFAHSNFHLLGEVIYQKLGINGLVYCDSSFGFGCYHGFFIKAISEKGPGVIKEMDIKCVEKFGLEGLGCPHGIGHGILEYLGHNKFDEALALCDSLSWKGDYFGCKGGVFMEYEFPIVFNEEGVGKATTRELSGDLYGPCNKVEQKYRQACYFEHSSWLISVLDSDYKKISNLCSKLNFLEKEACLLGLGNGIVERNFYNKNEVFEACKKIENLESQSLCFAGASWAFMANPDYSDGSVEICNEAYNKNICLKKRFLIGEK